jgi:hypothetical protein
MKTYVLTVSTKFPATHSKKGEDTCFKGKINFGIKIHTIRSNYELWTKRIKEVQDGNAIISLRYWSGKPYNSKQVEFAILDKDSGCGVQELIFFKNKFSYPVIPNDDYVIGLFLNLETLSKNDGLSFNDFQEWFKKYDISKPMAIIHFTGFRYCT